MSVAAIGYGQDSLKVSNSEKSEAIVSKMTRELTLDESQKAQLYKILDARWKELEKAKAGKSPVNWQSVNQGATADLKKILSPEQYEEFLKLREEKRQNRESFRSQNPDYVFSEEDKELDF